jgi:hypothetical protein
LKENYVKNDEDAKKTTVISMPQFSADAEKRWQQVSKLAKNEIMDNVWCGRCLTATAIRHWEGEMCGNSLILRGACKKCGGEVARVIEPAR